MSKTPEPQEARRVSIAACDCGTIYIRLHDANGEIFAYAVLPLETAVNMNEVMIQACTDAAGKAPPPGHVH